VKDKNSREQYINGLVRRGICDAIGDAISIQDTDFTILYQNKAHKNLIGEHIGEYCYIAFEGRDSLCENCPVDMVFKDGKVHRTKMSVPTEKGKIYIEITASALEDSEGEIIAGIEVMRDITRRKYINNKLQESENRYRSFVQNFQGIAYEGRFDFKPILFHGAVEKITGYTENEFTEGNLSWDKVIHPDDFSKIPTENTAPLLSIPNFSEEREYRIIRKDGTIRWVYEYIRNICDDSGKPILLQGTLYDITERKKMEEELKERLEELEKFYEIAISREIKMKELKEKIRRLEDELSQYKK
jgi:PAS domain S-box-containing protein